MAYEQSFKDKYPEVNWELVDRWEAMGYDKRVFYRDFTDNFSWIIPLCLFSIIVTGGIFLIIALVIYSIFGLTMQSEYNEYIVNVRMLLNENFTNWRK